MDLKLPNPYTGNYRLLMAAPVIAVLISLLFMFVISPVRLGIDFKGGITADILSPAQADVASLQAALEAGGWKVIKLESKPNPTGFVTQIEMERSDIVVKADALKSEYFALSKEAADLELSLVYKNDTETQNKFFEARKKADGVANQLFSTTGGALNASDYNYTQDLNRGVILAYGKFVDAQNEKLRGIISSGIPNSTSSFDEISSSLSTKFIEKALNVVVISIILTSIVVFLIFRTITPSIAVLAGAAADVIMAMGFMAFFGIPLTLASFAALLMLVGFSLDTDVLLTIRVIKRKEGHAAERAYEAMKTGLTMSLSAMVAFSCLLLLALTTHITVYYEIAVVALAGLVGDMIATWLFNAVIVLHYAEEVEKKGGAQPQRSLMSYIFSN